MKKLLSLLKATMSQDMNLFKVKKGESKNKAVILVLTLIVMFAVGSYAYMIAEALAPINQTIVMVNIFIIVTTLITFIEGIYKSQGILFEAKDNDLLFSMPIEKSKILFARIAKLITFQTLYNSLFIIPAFAVYIYFERPNVMFYAISVLMIFLLPIIPTILSSIIGYIVKGISTKFKLQKLFQTVLTLVFMIGIFFVALNLEQMIGGIEQNADNINQSLESVYYPVKLYSNLVQNFNIIELLKLLAINIIPTILFIYIASIFYFKIISKTTEKSGKKNKSISLNSKILKRRPKVVSLIKKELKRFLDSPVYIINTMFGGVIIVVATIGIAINFDEMLNAFVGQIGMGIDREQIINLMPKIFYEIVVFTSCLTSITSSMISIEGKSFNITKSLPVSTKKILLSKIMASNILSTPLILISDIIFFVTFKTEMIDIIYILLISIIMPTLIGVIGLLINLRFPKMDASSDTEVVKQSASSAIAVFIGMGIGIASIILMVTVGSNMNLNIFVMVELVALLFIIVVLWNILKIYGTKRFKEIEI